MNYEKTRLAFEEYLNNYDRKDGGINLKIIHTYEVVKLSEYIAKNLGLSEEDICLAKIIALLHDIGRFEQIKVFGAFDDKKLEHAKYSVKVLFEDNYLIRKFIEDDKYDDIIYKAIYNHNKLKIEDNLDERTLLHARIIRDADKLDNFRVKEVDRFEDMWPKVYNKETINYESISLPVYNTFISHKCIKLEDRKTLIDNWVCVIGFIYDLNFDISLKIVKDKNYINKLVNRIDYKNPDTKQKMEIIRNCAIKYIEERIK